MYVNIYMCMDCSRKLNNVLKLPTNMAHRSYYPG